MGRSTTQAVLRPYLRYASAGPLRTARIAAEAGALAFARWRADFARWEKAPGDPVCAVDLEVNALLRDRLNTLLPEAGWPSEETADNAARLAERARALSG